jgi:hypothetical protein
MPTTSLLIGYFEGLDSERGIAWRTADFPVIAQTTIGCRQPNSRREAATFSIACGGIFRALRAYGMIFSIAQTIMF